MKKYFLLAIMICLSFSIMPFTIIKAGDYDDYDHYDLGEAVRNLEDPRSTETSPSRQDPFEVEAKLSKVGINHFINYYKSILPPTPWAPAELMEKLAEADGHLHMRRLCEDLGINFKNNGNIEKYKEYLNKQRFHVDEAIRVQLSMKEMFPSSDPNLIGSYVLAINLSTSPQKAQAYEEAMQKLGN